MGHEPPVWLLDVDGVLNAVTKKPARNVWPADQWLRGEATSTGHTWPILAAQPVVDFIRDVHDQGRAEIRWHTTWQDEAVAIEKLLNLPTFPVQDAPEWAVHLRGETEEWWKLGAVRRVVTEERRPLVWTDDDADRFQVPAADRALLASATPSLVLCPSPYTGLTPKHLRKIDQFLKESA